MCVEKGVVTIARHEQGGRDQPRGSRPKGVGIGVIRQVPARVGDSVARDLRRRMLRSLDREINPGFHLATVGDLAVTRAEALKVGGLVGR